MAEMAAAEMRKFRAIISFTGVNGVQVRNVVIRAKTLDEASQIAEGVAMVFGAGSAVVRRTGRNFDAAPGRVTVSRAYEFSEDVTMDEITFEEAILWALKDGE